MGRMAGDEAGVHEPLGEDAPALPADGGNQDGE